jgi:hypothetical protein
VSTLDRREFIQLSAASMLIPSVRGEGGQGAAAPAGVSESGGTFRAHGSDYVWEWTRESDQFRLLDKQSLPIVTGNLQPAVIVKRRSGSADNVCSPGKPAGADAHDAGITVCYKGVNGSAKLALTWRFEDQGLWLDQVVYDTPAAEDVLSLHYFSEGDGKAHPSLSSDYLVLPGAMQCSVLNPVLPMGPYFNMKLDESYWLGRDYIESKGFLQQWGLPVHYFCAFHRSPYDLQETPAARVRQPESDNDLLDAFCCGLAELPNGDFFAETARNHYGFYVDYRSDLWGHQRGPASLALGAKLFWAVGPNYYEAIRRYYRGLLAAKVIRSKQNSPRKNAIAMAPSFDTWGAQVAVKQNPNDFDEPTLNAIYGGMKASRIGVKNFVIDGFWEGRYGDLAHSPERFPHFEQTLERMRSDGLYVGLWAAFTRCEDPDELGLTVEHMLRSPDGKPFTIFQSAPLPSRKFYLMDVTQPEVQTVMRSSVKRFLRRYKPDFIKFDFGYELPSLGIGGPKDMNWAGERVLLKGLEVVVSAMREENPDIVVMYYSLSPLFIDYIDLHSPDDLMISLGEYDLEANRRFFFSSLMGEIGMPTWGSGGYDWVTSPEIWFDSAVLGTVGSLGAFSGPLPETLATPERVAKYNGLSQLTRPVNTFSIEPIDADLYGPIRGAHCSSWARLESNEVVMVALRAHRLTGGKGSGRFRDLVSADASVVVASKGAEGITRAAVVAVVPYGTGELTIKRETGRVADMIEHYFGGDIQPKRLSIENGHLRVLLRERSESGSLVEWIEIKVSNS